MLTAYYDLSTSPPTYDIVAFLCAAEAYRIRKGKDGIHIKFLPGPKGGFRVDRLWPFSVEERTRIFHNVALPMARMLPSAVSVSVLNDPLQRSEEGSIGKGCRLYGLAVQVQSMRDGVRPLRPPEDLPRNPKLVTITLREAEHWPQRNSNVPAWIEAARAIQAQGFEVVIIRDTLKAGEPVEGLNVSRAAAWDLIARAQLYRSAVCNLGVSNGPMWFALALDAPVLMLKPTVENLMRTCSAGYFRECGIEPGGQIPGSPKYQQIVWQDDSAANIEPAFDAFMQQQQV
jgi:hypothetical protein